MDPLHSYIGNAEAFPILRNWDFFQHAGVAPLPHAAGQAMMEYVHQAESAAYLNSGWQAKIDQVRANAAALLNCDKAEIAFIKNTSEGLSIVANGIDWKAGDRIVTTNVEYPANIYPWMAVCERFGATLVQVQEEVDSQGRRSVPTQKLIEALKQAPTKLLALSHVEFASGQRHDLLALGNFCREHGILFSVDGIQSLGAVPVDLAAMKLDYLSADGHKWLLGPEGAGIFYCRKELLAHTRPLTVGWLNVVNATNFDRYSYTLRPDSGRFECGSQNVPGLLALDASLRMFLEVGMETVSQRIKVLTERLISGVTAKGYAVASVRDGNQWSGIVSFATDRHDPEKITANLRKEHRIEIMVRHGRLRASPHFYNTEAQIDRLVDLLPGH